MIEVENLTKQFGSLTAVNDLSFTVKGETFGFLGPNGAGKTTSIKMMTGLLKPTSGNVRICGHDIQNEPIEAKRLIGFVPDSPVLFDKLNPVEFLNFVGRIFEIDDVLLNKRIEDLLELFDLKKRSGDLIESFSHGMKQKCSLAGALIHDPKVLFLDEPTIGLDPKSAKILKDIFGSLSSRGVTVFLSTHILEIAQNICDRIGIINKGSLIANGTMSELQNSSKKGDKNLEDIFIDLTGGFENKEVLKYLDETR